MFWIGAAAGVAVALLAVIVGISAIGWGVGKERAKAADEKERIMAFWEEANRISQDKADIFADILTELRDSNKR
jgi:uncharacterized protein HemX